jgi:hypothetical protein
VLLTTLLVGSAISLPRVCAAQGEQLSDPTFDPSVARPAYRRGAGPRVGFDEAHFNFHTAGGRYKAFADLLIHDGYRLSPNRERFSPRVLRSYDLLVIANALGAPDPGAAAASSPAFTEAEARALAAYPTGAAAQSLATQLGVRMSDATVVDTTPGNHLEGYFQTNLEFTHANGLLKRHAITAGRDSTERVERVVAFGGQSLKGPAEAVCVLALGSAAFELSAQLVTEDGADGKTTHPWGMNWPGVDNRQLALNIARWLTEVLR